MAKVKLFGILRDKAKCRETSVPGDKTIRQLLGLLGDEYGPAVGGLLFEERDGELRKRPPVVILIDGISQTDLHRVVGADEVVSIFPAVAGG